MTPSELVDTLRGPLRNFSYRLPAADMIEKLHRENRDLQITIQQADRSISREQDKIRSLMKALKKAGGRSAVRKATR